MIGEKDGAIGRIIFNNPARHNAHLARHVAELGSAHGRLRERPADHVIVLIGAGGKAFVSGADISEFKEKRDSVEAAAAYAKTSENARLALQR